MTAPTFSDALPIEFVGAFSERPCHPERAIVSRRIFTVSRVQRFLGYARNDRKGEIINCQLTGGTAGERIATGIVRCPRNDVVFGWHAGYPLHCYKIGVLQEVAARRFLFWNGDGQHDLAIGFPTLGDGRDAGKLDFGQGLIEVM